MNAPPASIQVEVAYAGPDRALVKTYRLNCPATVQDALAAAAADRDFSALDLAISPVGVHGLRARLGQPLEEGDRVEIYRALSVDPKAARRARAATPSKSGRS